MMRSSPASALMVLPAAAEPPSAASSITSLPLVPVMVAMSSPPNPLPPRMTAYLDMRGIGGNRIIGGKIYFD
jgi:hypothetical protein